MHTIPLAPIEAIDALIPSSLFDHEFRCTDVDIMTTTFAPVINQVTTQLSKKPQNFERLFFLFIRI